MTYSTSEPLEIIFSVEGEEATDEYDEERWLDIETINGKTVAQCEEEELMEDGSEGVFEKENGFGEHETLKLVEIRPCKTRSEKPTSEQWFLLDWQEIGIDILWPQDDEPEEYKNAPFGSKLKITGKMWSECFNSIDYGWDYDGGFDIDKIEVMK